MNTASKAFAAAERFIRDESAFRLGMLPTETPHPETMTLGETLRADLEEGLRRILAVDADIAPALRRVMAADSAFARLREAIGVTLRGNGRVFFTGCGATGRLSILLESIWRAYWRDMARRLPRIAARAEAMRERVRGIMAGGDFALIKSVEGFEDFPVFGRRQLRAGGVTAGDLVIAVSEGGETPFVIGTVWEGLAAGAAVAFVFNNPAGLLRKHVARSREVLDDPRVIALDLTTGPMAVTGSTRMQAATAELLALGAALELSLFDFFASRDGADYRDMAAIFPAQAPEDYAENMAALQGALAGPANIAALARMVALEEDTYSRHGLLTYMADAGLLDILTDTAERSPTFMLPPFRMEGDALAPPSWAFVKHPWLPTPAAWDAVLERPPRGLDWDGAVYADMGAPDELAARPPALTSKTIRRFMIGNEPDPGRTGAGSILVLIITDADAEAAGRLTDAFSRQARAYAGQSLWTIGAGDLETRREALRIRLPPASSPLRLWTHLGVKLVMNTLSTATMGRLGRLRGNGMVWVNPGNRKLIDRGTRLVAQHTGLSYESACHALHAAMDDVRTMQAAGKEPPSPVAMAIAAATAHSRHSPESF